MSSKLSQIADAERARELAMNDYSENKPFEISNQPIPSGVDLGTPADIAERKKELARNDYSANKPYGLHNL